ncbi:hypothetical protein QTI95_14040 [Clostridium perfringens]|nr:hypothetical protein [Clostridium perfringens]
MKDEVFVCKNCGYEDSSYVPMMKNKIIKCPMCRKPVKRNIVLMEFGENLSLQDYAELLVYIDENHSFRKVKGKMIKYVRCTFDMRTHEIFAVSLDDKEFVKVNENRHRDLKKWIYEYLDQEEK